MKNKIGLVIAQEYKSRVQKKSFLLLTIFMPLFFLALILVPAWLASLDHDDVESEKRIAVVDQTGLYASVFADTAYRFEMVDAPIDTFRMQNLDYECVIVITDNLAEKPDAITIYSSRQVSRALRNHVADALSAFVTNEKLQAHNIDNLQQILDESHTEVVVNTVKWEKNVEDGSESESSAEVAGIVGMVFTMLIYMFIFVYGAQVMNSVLREKTNRIVEVLVCSVRPFELMMGKVISVALVGLTQFAVWIVLTAVLTILAGQFFDFGNIIGDSGMEWMNDAVAVTENSDLQNESIAQMVQSVNPIRILIFFVIYFLGGYLLYASLFAAVGALADADTDVQQFTFPITIPVIFAIYAAIYSVGNPDGQLAFWCSLIPFTSPFVMMVRLPFGVPTWQIMVSLLLLILTFVGSVWISAKIYRTGILMYGKKVTWRELWKWLHYK